MKSRPTILTKQAITGGAIWRASICGLALCALAACSSAPARDADTYYDLRPEIADITFGTTQVLQVQSVSVKGLQSGRSLVFETAASPVQYQEVRGHLWHVAPATLIETALADSLMAASQDMVIGTNDTIDDEDFRLKLIVSKFHFSPSQNAHIALDAVIKDRKGKIISSTRYDVQEPLSGSDYSDAVKALETALARIITALGSDIASAL